MKWKCPKKPCHPIKWEIGGVFRLLLAQLLQKALLLKYRCPANDLQNGKGGTFPQLPALPSLSLGHLPKAFVIYKLSERERTFRGREWDRARTTGKCGQDTQTHH